MNAPIPTLSIFIEPEILEFLESNTWFEVPLPSKMVVNNTSYETGITLRGNYTRELCKKSYKFDFGTFNEEFEGREIHLNAEYSDPSLIRNKLSFEFFQTIGSISPDCKHVFIELNGEPAGVYLQIESVDDCFLQKRKLPYGPIYYADNKHANFSLITTKGEPKPSLISGYYQKLGNNEDNVDLARLINKINTTPRPDFGEEIANYLDVKKYLLWLCGVVCTQNYDAFIKNYTLYKNGETGLYEMIPWDFDSTWGRSWSGRMMKNERVPIQGYNTLTARLLDVKEIRNQYRHLLEEILENSFTIEKLEPRITNLHNQLRPYITLDPYKKDTINLFDNELEFICRFIVKRNHYLREHLKELT